MGDEMSPISNDSPSAIDVDRNPAAQMALALVVLGLVLAINGVLTDAWLVTPLPGDDIESGLLDMTYGDETESFSDVHSDCSEMLEEFDANSSTIEEACGDFKEAHNAGLVGTILIWTGVAIFFAAMILQVFAVMGKRNIMTNIAPIAGGVIVGLGVLFWALMLPETDTKPDMGYGLWFAIISAGTGILAFFTPHFQSIIDGPPRMRAKGVRSGTDMSEFVLKESSCGNNSLSILVDDDLIRVVKVKRIGASPHVSDLLAANRSAYTGFSHQRLDWLDDFKGIWWVLAGASLISIFTITPWFTITFIFAALMAIAQLMDPERFVISTNSGNHSFMINRWRSNRELTNLAMDLVDGAMLEVLRGNELDTNALDARASSIAERFQSDERERQKALATSAPPVVNQQEMVAPIEQTVVTAPVPAPVENAEEVNLPVQEVSEPPSIEPVDSEPISQSSEEPEVEAEVEPEVEIEPAPAVVAAASIPPPPPLPEEIPSPAAVIPLPFTSVPPPPAVAAPPPAPAPIEMMPPPPPPGGAMALPPTPLTPATPPPPVVVHAAPREENLSADEKDNIMGDLMES